MQEGARLYLDSPAPAVIQETVRTATPAVSASPAYPASPAPRTGNGGGLSALDKIRKQYKGNGQNGAAVAARPLDTESLHKAWAGYIEKLKAERNPAAQPFSLARLRIVDPQTFEVVTGNNIEQKFIEQERNSLFHFLQEQLQNKQLQFSVLVEENTGEKQVAEPVLTSKEQFLKMAQAYPLVGELRDRLRLELDY